jgi:YgiT-type zinc finger domain-containing protein
LLTTARPGCAHCGNGQVLLKHVTRSFGSGYEFLIIENIPLWSCSACGESYFTAQTMYEIERIKVLRKSLAIIKNVSVAEFEPDVV